MVENVVFMELKNRGYTLYYHKGTRECDFIVESRGEIVHAIQVTYDMIANTTKTFDREVEGLKESMDTYSLESGTIITENFEDPDLLKDSKYDIKIVPIYEWLLGIQ